MPLELSQPRVFAFTDRKRKYSITCKPITKEMWLKYFAGIISTSETSNGSSESSYDSAGARVALLESAVVDCSGYDVSDDTKAANPTGWQSNLPLRHRRAVADMLVDVDVIATADDAIPAFGFEAVDLKAKWSSDENGRMQEFSGLRHIFGEPTAEQQTRYSRAMSRSVVTGGRNGQTRWLGGQDVMIELYDELITAVAGYTSNNEPLNNRNDLIVAAMDAYHKVAAISALFTPIDIGAE